MKKSYGSVLILMGVLMLLLLVGCGKDKATPPETQYQAPSEQLPSDQDAPTLGKLYEFDYNAGMVSCSAPEESAVKVGDEITLSAEANEGYYFIGWSSADYLENYGDLVSEENAYTYTVSDETVYYANFVRETEALLCYYANGGTINSAEAKGDRLIQKVEMGEHKYPMTLSQNGTFFKDGYNIVEYNTEADGSGVVTNIGQRVFAPNDRLIPIYVQWAEESQEDLFVFEQQEDGYYISAYTGEETVLSVPSEYNGTAVVGILSNAISAPSAETVILPDTIRCIQENAFTGCTSLTKLYLFDSVIEMTDESFTDCPIKTVCLNSVFEKKYYGEGTGKLELLHLGQMDADNRLIVVSGSSGLFALDCELLQSSLTRDYTVINFALQIAVPNTFAMSVMQPYLHEGDAVVLAPEAELKQYNNKLTTMVFTKYDGSFTSFRNVDVSMYRSFFSSLSVFALAKQAEEESLMAASEQFYTYNGDTANNHQQEEFASNYSFTSPLYHYDMSELIYQQYNRIVDGLAEQGITCYLSFGPFCTEACEDEVTAEMLDEYSTEFGNRLHAIRISDQSSYDFPKEYFFEMYHMTQEGKELRTKQLIEDLNAQFEKE